MTYRSKQIEMMDDLNMEGELLVKTLDKIAQINRWLGGNKLTTKGVLQLLEQKSKQREYTIIDLGCGNGDMLRMLAELSEDKNYNFRLIGIDANQATIEYAKQLSSNYNNIEYRKLDILDEDFEKFEFDIALSTLFLHHFETEQIHKLVGQWVSKAKLGVVINDLHRHPIAYFLFKIIAFLIGNEMVKKDGLISILRGFKKSELELFANRIKFKSSILWKWAFRYQWIIQK